jgi:hypothetical protein
MTHQITRSAQRALRRAWIESEWHELKYFSDSQFLGILHESTSVAARILKQNGLDARRAIQDVLTLAGSTGTRSCEPEGWFVGFRKVHECKGACMDTPYFLLGILGEQEGAAVEALKRQRVSIAAVRAAAE